MVKKNKRLLKNIKIGLFIIIILVIINRETLINFFDVTNIVQNVPNPEFFSSLGGGGLR